MSGGGGGIIIIQNLIDNPGATAIEKDELRAIRDRIQKSGKCATKDAKKAAAICQRLLLRG